MSKTTKEVAEKAIKDIANYNCDFDQNCTDCIFSSPFGCLQSSIQKHLELLEGLKKYEK